MTVLIVFAHVWGVLQIVLFGSLSRTVGVRTVLAAFVVGLYGASTATVLLQLLWTRPFSWLTGIPLSTVVGGASYTLDPVIEEIVKLLPLAAVLMLPAVRRQWSLTDCVLLGGATGSGFGLAEAVLRFGTSATRAFAVADGWAFPAGFSAGTVPGLTTTMTSWLPAGVISQSLFGNAAVGGHLNLHLVYSALAGLGLGLVVLRGGRLEWLAGAALIFYVSADHAAFNADVTSSWRLISLLTTPFRYARHLFDVLPLAALGFAWWFDRQSHYRQPRPALPLAPERTVSPAFIGALTASLGRLPWSPLFVASYTRLRRAYTADDRARVGSTDELKTTLIALRNVIEQTAGIGPSVAWVAGARAWSAIHAWLRQPKTMLWLLLTAPSVLWFVVGAYPATSMVQRVMASAPAWLIVRALSVASLVWLAREVFRALRRWTAVKAAPLGEVSAAFALRLAAGAGALAAGAYACAVSLTNASPYASLVTNAHILEALGSALVITALLAALMALFLFPPGGLALAGGGVLGGALTANMMAHIAGVLGLAGVLMMAGGGTPGNNQAQNRQFRDAVREAEGKLGRKLNKGEVRRVHDEISGQNYGFQEIIEAILGLFG